MMNPCVKDPASRCAELKKSPNNVLILPSSNGSLGTSSHRPYFCFSRTRSLFCALPPKVRVHVTVHHAFLSYSRLAKILSQIEQAIPSVTIEILARAKGKDQSNDTALPMLVERYISASKVGSLTKETPSGKLVSEWQAALTESSSKPEIVDMSPAVSSLMSVKDDEELVCAVYIS
jgi:nucleosome binding factor SPN SPT16 subunit